MTDPQAATEAQLRTITARTGMTIGDFTAALGPRVTLPHGQLVAVLKAEFGLTHGNANLVAHRVREAASGGPAAPDDLLAAQYRGDKAALRPVHDRIVELVTGFGADVQVVTQKTGVALRRKRQLGVIGAPSGGRIPLGLNLPADPGDPRVQATPGMMCSHRVDLRDVGAVDADVEAWLRQAYDRAG